MTLGWPPPGLIGDAADLQQESDTYQTNFKGLSEAEMALRKAVKPLQTAAQPRGFAKEKNPPAEGTHLQLKEPICS